MGNQAAAPQLQAGGGGGGEPRHQDGSFHGVRHADAVAPRDDDGAGTSAAVAGARPDQRARSGGEQRAGQGRAPPGPEQPPVVCGAGAVDEAPARMPPRRPSYSPVRQRREAEEQHRAASILPAAGNGQPGATTPVILVAELRPKRTITTPKAIGRTRTLVDDDGAFQDERSPRGGWSAARAPPRGAKYSPTLKKERRPVLLCYCCMVYCIHILLLVIAVGLAIIIVYRAYHPKSPRLRVTSATLNAGHIDQLDGGTWALNVNLTVVAAISNPNTKISIVLRYVQLNLYFEGSMIGTQAVWPAPLHQPPRGSVRLVASNVTMTPEAVFVWQNATTKGGRGPVVMQLAGRIHTQLNFGRWFKCRYWASPQCTLWLDPPPRGALRRSQC